MSENRLANFLSSVPGAEDAGAAGTDSGLGSDEDAGGGGLWLVTVLSIRLVQELSRYGCQSRVFVHLVLYLVWHNIV